MKILVYPHDLNMGGSQMNAIELAAAVRDLGHECLIYGRPGVLCDRISELGLEFVASTPPGRRPSATIVRELRSISAARKIDIIHGYEWPPGLEAALATVRSPTKAMCTVMSMAVAPFLPRDMPLVVGTQQIAAHEMAIGRSAVDVIEPPVDLAYNQSVDADLVSAFKRTWGLGDLPLLVCVSRLANELKAEGILAAIDAAGSHGSESPFQLLIVGDGSARDAVEAAAEKANRQAGRAVVVVTGELADPRPAYAAADIVLGMGGSALRALAFGKPLIVQGEQGFFQTLTPHSVAQFRWQGWYGVGGGVEAGRRNFWSELRPLLEDSDLRSRLGLFSREVVADFSLRSAAVKQVQLYEGLLHSRPTNSVTEVARAGRQLLQYKLRRRIDTLRGGRQLDDFNAQPVASTAANTRGSTVERKADGPIVYLPGVDWDAVPGTDRHLATALGQLHKVVWVDPPRSMVRQRVSGVGDSHPAPGVTRLQTTAPPGVSRPILRNIALWLQTRRLRKYLKGRSTNPSAIIASGTEATLAATRSLQGVKAYLATDDFVEAASLWGISPTYLAANREANLRVADLVLAVTPALAAHVRRGNREPIWFPNGADLQRYAAIGDVEPSPLVTLPSPRAGVVGQFNERTDLSLLRAVADAGIALLLVGPKSFATDAADREFTRLTGQETVQWLGRVEQDVLPSVFKAIDVGLTAYADTAFNRRSYPLKTVEYLAAGVPVVTTRVAPIAQFSRRYVIGADEPDDFVEAVRRSLASRPPAMEIQESVADHAWAVRAETLLELIREAANHDAH